MDLLKVLWVGRSKPDQLGQKTGQKLTIIPSRLPELKQKPVFFCAS